jgi:predicted NBD/HSP70 family sugar kinase
LLAENFVIIGVDGGASKVSSWVIRLAENGQFGLTEIHSERKYCEYPEYDPEFISVDLQKQLAESRADQIKLTQAEIRQGRVYHNACAETIIEVARKAHSQGVLIGIGMPGLKTADRRGIAVMANGPRILNYARQLEKHITAAGIKLLMPIAQIGSDAYYCGVGEEYAVNGNFRDVRNAYYLGGGTGAADALKLNNKLISLDVIQGWFVKTWELRSPGGESLEKYVSSNGIQSLYGELAGISVAELNRAGIYPVQICERALQGENTALLTVQQVVRYLALLIYERITTLFAGWQGYFQFNNPERVIPLSEHKYQGYLFDKIILGQRLGGIFGLAANYSILAKPFYRSLSLLLNESAVLTKEACQHYCRQENLQEELIICSNLREAPALGAGIDAYLKYKERKLC